jgi:tryptophan synthase beta chain
VTVVDASGRFGEFGGRYVPEALMGALDELERAWETASADGSFGHQLAELRRNVVGRPTPLYECC